MTEQQLIKGCIQRNVDCQRMLFEQYAGRMMSICLRYSCDRPEAEDMLQEAFIKIFSHIGQYKFEGSFEGWMKRIVVNCALKMIQKKRIRFSELSNQDLIPTQTDSYALSSLTEDELLKLISKLPDGYRIVFNLYVMEEYSHDEIAVLLGIEATTSRSQLVKARKLLQKQILSNQKIAI
ncbi:MAG TPA: sigma-70 family RNA polymerase sigma factor [Chitinophagaceae bacterium]|nr:sigma-70 family RNA polymerase sigma factor [Chitinophagaceae bacterium]